MEHGAMKLFYSPTSPYVRKVSVLAIETGLDKRIERVLVKTSPVNRNAELGAENPLGKVPTLLTDEGAVLYDSRVICEFLDSLHSGPKFFPTGAARWKALQLQALGDGMLDAAVLARAEDFLRPVDRQWADWRDGQMKKVDAGLQVIEEEAAELGSRMDIGTITMGCALGYLDLRFASKDWRSAWPGAAAWYASLSARPSFQATIPVDPA